MEDIDEARQQRRMIQRERLNYEEEIYAGSKCASSDVERSNSSLNTIDDVQLSSDGSSTRKRFSKIFKNFRKPSKRSFNRGRVDRVMLGTDQGEDCWDSSSAECHQFAEDDCSISGKHNETEDDSWTLDSQSINSSENVDDDILIENGQSKPQSMPFFALNVILKEGKDLVIRDKTGTSDPYVKFSIAGKQYFKSRTVFKNLCPKWDERFSIPIEDRHQPVLVQVFDYDRGLPDDPMGAATINPHELEINNPTDCKLMLASEQIKKKKSPEYMGYITLNCTLVPMSQTDKEQYTGHVTKAVGQKKKHKTQFLSGVVTVLLIDGNNLLSMDDNGFSDPYVKFRLGSERYKSKYKQKTLTPKWLEQFDLYLYDDQTSCLDISIWDYDIRGKDEFMGRAILDLSHLERDRTHSLSVELDDKAGSIRLLVTITATASNCQLNGVASKALADASNIVKQYGFHKSFRDLKDVGFLQVKVIKARGLAAADIGGKSDPFCILELVNSRVQTTTEYRTLSPCWGKTFTFEVKDIHSILEVSVFDEDPDKKVDFLGKVAIPLLKIQNGHKRWYQLKDQKLVTQTKGVIKLEMTLIFNHFKAAIRTFNPREVKYLVPEPKFRIAVMKNNIDRVSRIVHAVIEPVKFAHSCFGWENNVRSTAAFAVFLIFVWNFELYMIPILLLIIYVKNLFAVSLDQSVFKDKSQDNYLKIENDEGEEKETKEEKKSLTEKFQAIQDICLQVQEFADTIASVGERIKNSFQWSVPWLSWLAVVLLLVVAVVLYLIPLRYLVLLWGINKFTKKLRAPNSIPNNELLDYLSRVPSDREMLLYQEFQPDPILTARKKKQ